MKKVVLMTCSVLVAIVAMTSCNKDYEHYVEPQKVDNPFSGAVPTGYYNYAEISVPAATDKVYVMYEYKDGTTKVIEQPVTPKVTVPTDGKQVEPFGTVKLMFQSETPAVVSKVFFTMEEATKAAGDYDDEPYTLENFPVNQVTSGEFGKTRYVQVNWNFYMTNSEATGWQNAPSYPKDVVFYDSEHNHTLHYTFAYPGTVKADAAYVLTDFYEVEDHVVTALKNHYCGQNCVGCMMCMPWGCACGCAGYGPNGSPIYSPNPYFQPSGDTTSEAGPDDIVVDPTTPSETPTGDGGTVIVDENGTIYVDYAPADVESIFLPEPASYTNTILDEEGNVKSTTYHSSGVVMFDDRFPSLPDVDYQYDYNDVVIDYDIFALTVADEFLEEDGWREKVKVTMHVRALGGDDGIGVGVVLENFNTDFVDYVDCYATLDSGGHGDLPQWTETTLQENSLHYDPTPEAGEFKTKNNLRPAVEIGRLQALNSVDGNWSKQTGLNSGTQPYFYENGSIRQEHVFNPARKLYNAWGGSHDDQFDPSLDDLYRSSINKKLSDIQNFKLYNTVPGYLNKNGGLYTFTVEYYVKARAEMSPEDREACLANMVEAVVNTNNQNFYIVKKDHTPVGLKGYEPLDVPAKAWSKGYKARYEEVVAANTDKVDRSTYFLATNGMVWGFKCPTLTKHTWELMPFAVAYPHYKEWVESKGVSHADWYKADVNTAALVCEW
jgi:hypothetical protein